MARFCMLLCRRTNCDVKENINEMFSISLFTMENRQCNRIQHNDEKVYTWVDFIVSKRIYPVCDGVLGDSSCQGMP